MWTCSKCGCTVHDSANMCRNCGTTREAREDANVDQMAGQSVSSEVEPTWVCPHCGEAVPESFEVCWKCQADRDAAAPSGSQGATGHAAPAGGEPHAREPDSPPLHSMPRRRVAFRHFESAWESWSQLFHEAADFASRLGPERLISISHSEDQNEGVVTVWYWEDS